MRSPIAKFLSEEELAAFRSAARRRPCSSAPTSRRWSRGARRAAHHLGARARPDRRRRVAVPLGHRLPDVRVGRGRAALDGRAPPVHAPDRRVARAVDSDPGQRVAHGVRPDRERQRARRRLVPDPRARAAARVFDLLEITPEEQRQKFGFLLDALAMGAPPHGGIAFGIDRISMALLDEPNHPRHGRVPEEPGRRRPDDRARRRRSRRNSWPSSESRSCRKDEWRHSRFSRHTCASDARVRRRGSAWHRRSRGSVAAPALTPLPRVEDLPAPPTDTTARRSARRSRPSAATRRSSRFSFACSRPPAQSGGRADRPRRADGRAAHDPRRGRVGRHDRARRADRFGGAASPHRGGGPRRQRELQERAGRGRPLPPGERAPARRDAERRQERGAPDARRTPSSRPRRRSRRPRRGQPAARAVAPPGDRAHELGAGRGRADARVGARAGRRDHQPRAGRRRAAAQRSRSRRRRDRPCRRSRSSAPRRLQPRRAAAPAPPPACQAQAARAGACRAEAPPRGTRSAAALTAGLAGPFAPPATASRAKTTAPARLGPCCRAGSDSASRSRRSSSSCSPSVRASPTCDRRSSCS